MTLAAAAVVAAGVLAERESPDKHSSPDNAAVQNQSDSPAETGAEATPRPARARSRPVPLGANEPGDAASAPAQAKIGRVFLEGCVLDDLTGQPVTDYALSTGFFTMSGHHEAGRFESDFGMETGRKVELRVLAAEWHVDKT